MPRENSCTDNFAILFTNFFIAIENRAIPLHLNKNIIYTFHKFVYGGACGVIVIVVGNGHGDTSSNPGRDWLHFT